MTHGPKRPVPKSDGEECEQCSQVHITRHGKKSCSAHLAVGERKGDPCTHEAGWGTNHVGFGLCRKHGGNTDSAKKNAQRQMVEDEVRQQLGLEDWVPITDPYSALADHAGKGAAIEEILRLKVEELSSLKQYGGDLGDRISVIFEAWERAYARLSSNLQAMARLDLEDRIARVQSRVDERTSELVSGALAGALNAGNVSAEDRDAIMREFGNLLRRDEPQKALSAP